MKRGGLSWPEADAIYGSDIFLGGIGFFDFPAGAAHMGGSFGNFSGGLSPRREIASADEMGPEMLLFIRQAIGLFPQGDALHQESHVLCQGAHGL